MNKTIKKINKILTVVFATLLCILIPGYEVAMNYATMVNQVLKIEKLYKIVETGAGEEDTDYFPAEIAVERADYPDTDAGLAAYNAACAAAVPVLSAYCDEVSKEVEGEGLVLLKNGIVDGKAALPLSAGDQVSCFLYASVSLNYSATGSGEAVVDGYPDLKAALEANNFGVNKTLSDFYKTLSGYGRIKQLEGFPTQIMTYTVREAPWSKYTEAPDVIGSFARYGDAAIAVIARESGEGSVDLTVSGSDGEKGDYLSITPQEEGVLKELTRLKAAGMFKKIIVLLNSSAPMELDFLFRDGIGVDACMWIGNLGRAGAYAVSDALAGKIVPSGKASDTFCRDNLSSPAMAAWKLNPNGAFAQRYTNWNSGINASSNLNVTQQYYGVYNEGIYVGYRYYETRYEDYVLNQGGAGTYSYAKDVAYPFGYGISYTEFDYSDFSVTEKDDEFTVSVKVTNKGGRPGKEAVQVYLQKPYSAHDKQYGVEKAAVELAGFAKTKELGTSAGNNSETVTMEVSKETFKSYDAENAKTYILSEGKYYLGIGNGAHAALNNILAAKGHTPANTDGRMDAEGKGALAKMVWDNPAVDKVKYSKSVETDEAVTNQLDFADINRYQYKGDNKVTYVSRSDWAGTWPAARIRLSVSGAEMKADLGSKKPIAEDGSASPAYGKSGVLTLAMLRGLDYGDDLWNDLLDQMTFAEQAKFLTSAGFGTKAVKSVNNPGTTDSDGPTAVTAGSRTGASYPSEGIWASSFNLDLVGKVGAMFGEDARMADKDSMYAPGLNMHRTPYGGRSHEYFSEDPFLSGMAAVAEVKGMQSRGIIPTLKHFAFNDEESERNGIGIWLNEQSAREIYLLPFEYAMRPSMGNAHGIMTSFNRAGCIWTSASSELMINISRAEWGFDGYSITDMVSANGPLYMTYVDGFMNGTELFLDTSSGNALSEYGGSPAFQNKIREATKRVLYTVCNYSSAMNGVSTTSKIVKIMPWWQILLTALLIVFAVLTAAGIGIWAYCIVKDTLARKKYTTPERLKR